MIKKKILEIKKNYDFDRVKIKEAGLPGVRYIKFYKGNKLQIGIILGDIKGK